MSHFLNDNSSSQFDLMSELDVELLTKKKKEGVSRISFSSPRVGENELSNELPNALPHSCGTPPP